MQIAANQSQDFALPIELPPVGEGVTFDTQMTITLVDRAGEERARTEDTLWLFPKDPFAARREWLKGLNIHLYDPEGATEVIFEQANIPFDKLTNSNTLASLEEGILVVGEGTSLRKNRAMAAALFSLAQRGIPVLCLGPVDGELPWPTREDYPHLAQVRLASNEIVREFDKRLSAKFAPDPSSPASTVSLESRRGRLTLHISDSSEGWPWWQLDFENHGTCIVCCLPLVEHWDDSPTPRFLFASILEELSSGFQLSPAEQ